MTIPIQKIIQLLAFLNLYQQGTQLNSSIYSWDAADFRVPWPKRSCPFLKTTTQKLLRKLLALLNLYQQAKSQHRSNIHSWDRNFTNPWTKRSRQFMNRPTQFMKRPTQKLLKKTLLSRICISRQKINSIYWFIFETQQGLESLDLKGHLHLWPNLPKIIKVTFSFSEFVSAC